MIDEIRQERRPSGLAPVQVAALSATECVLDRRTIPQSVQDALVEEVGLKGVIELVVLCGFYQMIAAVIFAFDVSLPEGERDPFKQDAG